MASRLLLFIKLRPLVDQGVSISVDKFLIGLPIKLSFFLRFTIIIMKKLKPRDII